MKVHRAFVLFCVLAAFPPAAFAQSSAAEFEKRYIDATRAELKDKIAALKKTVAAEQARLKRLERGIVDRRATEATIPESPKQSARFPTAESKKDAVAKAGAHLAELQKELKKLEAWSPFITDGHDDPIEVGDVGVFPVEVRLIQIIDDDTALAEIYDHMFFLEGVPLVGKTDDSSVRIAGLFKATGTKKYAAVSGASRTTLVIEPVDAPKQ